MLNDFTFVFHLKTKCMQKAFFKPCLSWYGDYIVPPVCKIELKNDSSHRLVCCSFIPSYCHGFNRDKSKTTY